MIGTFGVAINRNKHIAVPFVVGDGGPSVGEGSAALARLVAGKPVTDLVTRKNRNVGQVDAPDILWVFFGGHATTYNHTDEGKLTSDAQQAYEKWGGEARLRERGSEKLVACFRDGLRLRGTAEVHVIARPASIAK